MQNNQQTLKAPISFSGISIHSECSTTVTCLPAEPNYGIKFQRVDIEGKPIIEALAEYVTDTTRSTTLQNKEGYLVDTVEHLLAALAGASIDNAHIEIDGPEIPILDGSAKPFTQALQSVGIVEQNTPRNFFEITQPIYHKLGNESEIHAFPSPDYKLAVMVSYKAEGLHNQYAYLPQIEDFAKEIAPNRTFTLLSELESLHAYGLIKGGNLDNALVIIDKEIEKKELNHLANLFKLDKDLLAVKGNTFARTPMHFPNEPARHKLLDLVGDLVLLGRPIKGYIVAHKPGHKINIEFVKKLRKIILEQQRMDTLSYDPHQAAIFTIKDITKMLPHRYPFQLVDKVIALDEKSIVAVKNVTINEPFFQGHFPNEPVMPGVLQIEAMVQAGGILVLHKMPEPHLYSTYFLSIENCRFRKMVVPGDVLVMDCKLITEIKLGIIKMLGRALVDNKVVCEATMVAKIAKKHEPTY